MFFKDWFRPPKPPTDIDIALSKLKTINVPQYKNSYSSDYSLFTLNVYKKTIVQYNKLLRIVLEKLDQDQLIPKYDLPFENHSVYLRDFLTDDQGRFVDIESTLQEFLDLATEFLTTFQTLEQSDEKSFNIEKNLLLTQHVVANLRSLIMESL